MMSFSLFGEKYLGKIKFFLKLVQIKHGKDLLEEFLAPQSLDIS